MEFMDNSIIICSNDEKKNILRKCFSQKKLWNYTFFTKKEFKERFYFKITKKAIAYAMNFYNTTYDIASVLIENIYYVDINCEYEDKKLIDLVSLKKNLIYAGLLELEPNFKELIKGKDIYLLETDLDVFDNIMFNEVSKIATLIKEDKMLVDKDIIVNEFADYKEEVDYVFSCISNLINQGVDINKIVILNNSDEYNHLIRRYSKLYTIPVLLEEKESIKNHFIVKKFFTMLDDGKPLDEIFEELKKYSNEHIINSLVSLVNDFNFIKDRKILSNILKVEIDNLPYKKEKLTDVVRVLEFNSAVSDDEIAFLIGFNNDAIPKKYRDDNYLTDKFASIIPITLTLQRNELERIKAKKLISNIKNLHLSYSKITNTSHVISTTASDFNSTIIKENKSALGLNKKADLLKLGLKLDSFVNYGVHEEVLNILYSSFDELYKTYNNDFKEIDKELLSEKLANTIMLSYSSISTFYKCNFQYYLEKVLKVKYDDDKKAAKLGSMFHEILEHYGRSDFDLELERQNQINSVKDQSILFYFDKLWPDFLLAIKAIDDFKESTYLKDEMHETKLELQFESSKYKNIFTGIIDKIMYKNVDGVDYIAVVDYKSGSQKAILDNIDTGFNLQLPIYAYFLVKSELFKNPKILGLYLQHIISNTTDKTKSLEEEKMNNLKLDGYSVMDQPALSLFDPTYKKSRYIKSMSVTKDGNFGRYTKLYTEEELNKIISLVEELITGAFEKIEAGEFTINPKVIGDDNESCKFCHYNDICYKKNSNLIKLKAKKIEEVLAGE